MADPAPMPSPQGRAAWFVLALDTLRVGVVLLDERAIELYGESLRSGTRHAR